MNCKRFSKREYEQKLRKRYAMRKSQAIINFINKVNVNSELLKESE